jgi:hypothetical protein
VPSFGGAVANHIIRNPYLRHPLTFSELYIFSFNPRVKKILSILSGQIMWEEPVAAMNKIL